MNCPATGKTQYQSEKEAAKGLERFKAQNPEYTGEPYLCLYCHLYHFGSRKPRKPKGRKRTGK